MEWSYVQHYELLISYMLLIILWKPKLGDIAIGSDWSDGLMASLSEAKIKVDFCHYKTSLISQLQNANL